MATELGERLARLADGAGYALATPATHESWAHELWARGVRRHRVRRAVTAAVVLLVAGLGGLGAGGLAARVPVQVATPPDGAPAVGLPDHLYTPGRWLTGTDDAGPLGPLVAVVGGPRAAHWWGGTRNGLAGVSATGEYRYLDLPGAIEDFSSIALSAGGHRIAYWTQGGRPANGSARPVVSGVAVYDTTTGQVTRHDLAGPHGVTPEGLAWAGDVLWVCYGEDISDSASRTRAARWAPRTQVWEPLPDSDLPWATGVRNATPTGAGAIVAVTERADRAPVENGFAHLSGTGLRDWFATDVAFQHPPVTSPNGRRLAGIEMPNPDMSDGEPHRLMAWAALPGSLPGGPIEPAERYGIQTARYHLTAVPGVTGHQVLGWRDDDHAVVQLADGVTVASVDVRTGATEPLTRFEGTNWTPGKIVAAEAWSAPVVQAGEPRWPPDPRLVAVGVAVAVLVSARSALWWRRRRATT